MRLFRPNRDSQLGRNRPGRICCVYRILEGGVQVLEKFAQNLDETGLICIFPKCLGRFSRFLAEDTAEIGGVIETNFGRNLGHG